MGLFEIAIDDFFALGRRGIIHGITTRFVMWAFKNGALVRNR